MDPVDEFVIESLMGVYGNADIADLDRRVSYPLTIMSSTVDFAIHDFGELEQTVTVMRQGFRSGGVVAVRPEILTVFQPEQGMAVVSTRNTRLDVDGGELGTHRSTYILRHHDHWRFKAMSFSNERYDQLKERVEKLLEAEGVLRRLPSGKGDRT